jgi:hypothetical protein
LEEKENLMPRGIWIAFFFLLMPWTLAAQDVPKVEIFGGYSYFRMPSGIYFDVDHISRDQAGLNGLNVTVTGNFNRWLGAEFDFGRYSGTVRTGSARYGGGFENLMNTIDIRSYLFGPRFSYRGDRRFTPFVHALFGVVGFPDVPGYGAPDYPFGLALGGGFDIKVVRHVAIRAIQADYVVSYLEPPHENNFRLSFGAALRF